MRIAIILLAALCLYGNDARAAPWCAHFNTGLNDCNFYSFRQCSVAVAGIGGYCSRNGFARPYWSGYDGRRRYRRDF